LKERKSPLNKQTDIIMIFTKEGDQLKNSYAHVNEDLIQAASTAFNNLKFESLSKLKSANPIAEGKFKKFAVRVDVLAPSSTHYNIQAHVKDVLGNASVISHVQIPIATYKEANNEDSKEQLLVEVKHALSQSLGTWKNKSGRVYLIDGNVAAGREIGAV
jgi:hypothetical protein